MYPYHVGRLAEDLYEFASHARNTGPIPVSSCRLAGGASSFRYLAKSSTLTLPGVDDAEGLRSTLDAMAIVGLNEDERNAILQVSISVLGRGADIGVPDSLGLYL